MGRIEGNEITADWARTTDEFDTDHIPYIPNIAHQDKEGRPKHTPLTQDLVIPPNETYAWEKVRAVTYIHEVVLEGRLNSPRRRKAQFEGYIPYDRRSDDPEVYAPVTMEGFRQIRSFRGAGGSFHIRWGRR